MRKSGGGRATYSRPADGLSECPLTTPLQSRLTPSLDLTHRSTELCPQVWVHRTRERTDPRREEWIQGVLFCRGWSEGERAREVGAGEVRCQEVVRGEGTGGDDAVLGQVREEERLAWSKRQRGGRSDGSAEDALVDCSSYCSDLAAELSRM